MKIVFYCNFVLRGWGAENLDKGGIGGSEEMLIMLSERIAKDGHEVVIYHNGTHGEYNGVIHKDFKEFKPFEPCDVFVSFKNKGIFSNTINAERLVHWSHEIEDLSLYKDINNVVLTNYHRGECGSIGEIIPNFMDIARLDNNKVEKEEKSALYCSSFDRGLEELLIEWQKVKDVFGIDKLYVTYGWGFINRMLADNPQMLPWVDRMKGMLKQEGVVELGEVSYDEMCKLYWKSKYWVLPLNKPESELFCINAIKAQHCETIPIVRRIGALAETVNNFIDWDSQVYGDVGISKFDDKSIKQNKNFVEQFDINEVYKKWKKILSL